MKSLLLSCAILAGTAGAQLTTGTITQTGNCQVAGVIGNPSIVCQGIPPDVVRALNKHFEAELKSKDTQIQTLTKDANQWKDRYVDLANRVSYSDLNPTQKSEAESLLRLGELDEASRLLSSIDKKLDNLSAKIDCSGATDEAFALALEALDADRVITLWHCRPENTISDKVQTPYLFLFSSGQFPAAKPFLDQLVTKGFNPLKDIKPIPSSGFYNVPLYRPLNEGNIDAIRWIIDHAPPGYWNSYSHLMENLTSIMQLPHARFPVATATRAITMLREAGVPVDTNDYQAFREAYKKWLESQIPGELKVALGRPTGVAATYAQQMRTMYPSTQQTPQYAEIWKAVSDALSPVSAEALRSAKSEVAAAITSGDIDSLDQRIKQLTDQLGHRTWWRKLPETQEVINEAKRRQSVNGFDSYGYVQVVSGAPQDADLLPWNTTAPVGYPNCNCYTAGQLRDQLMKASKRKDALLQFQATFSH